MQNWCWGRGEVSGGGGARDRSDETYLRRDTVQVPSLLPEGLDPRVHGEEDRRVCRGDTQLAEGPWEEEHHHADEDELLHAHDGLKVPRVWAIVGEEEADRIDRRVVLPAVGHDRGLVPAKQQPVPDRDAKRVRDGHQAGPQYGERVVGRVAVDTDCRAKQSDKGRGGDA